MTEKTHHEILAEKRRARLEEELRVNLRRRKMQAKARRSAGEGDEAETPEDGDVAPS